MVTRLRLAALLAGSAQLLFPHPAGAAPAGCRDLIARAPAAGAARTVIARDLVGLRDLGTSGDTSPPFTISPDGTKIAFQLRRADPDRNSYCLAMLVLDLKAGTPPRPIDEGGELIRMTFARQGVTALPTGYPAAIVPHWSPDGRSIAFLKRQSGRTQAWLAAVDGSGSRPLPSFTSDVEDVAWLPEGKRLVVESRPELGDAERALDREGLSGYHYDDRFTPMAGNRPAVRAPVEKQFLVVNATSQQTRAATASERAVLSIGQSGDRPPGALLVDRSTAGDAVAWTAARDPDRYASPAALHVRWDGREKPCSVAACVGGFELLGWTADGRALRFFHREGWGESRLALYRWTQAEDRPRRMWSTANLLIGCQALGANLLCAEEESTRPRRLVLVDADSGHLRTLFDPNPAFARLNLGRVTRLEWRNGFGIESFGDLVLPPDHVAGEKHPLVVVQYRTRGFLRGGTGDEFPIQALAARGFAVLSIDRPADTADRSDARSDVEYNQAELHDWQDRRSVLSSIERGVALAIARGVVDPDRIGITGLSDGASTAQFALINSRLFHAAVIAGCCEDPQTVMTMTGPALAAAMHAWGYPLLSKPQPDFWKPYSLALNAGRIETPILMLSADREYLPALEPYTALREWGRPVDLYVFPDEYHTLWQPAHRLAAYEKTLDWFDLWLRGIEQPGSSRQSQYAYWRALRDAAAQSGSAD